MLAAIGLLGIDPLHGARLLNAVVFGLLVFFSGQLFLMTLNSKTFALLAAVGVLFSVPLLHVSTMAWTELLFALLIIIFTICLIRFSKESTLGIFAALCVVVSLAFLQRYAGVTLVISGLLVIGFGIRNISVLARSLYLAVFGVVATLPVAMWMGRNYLLTGTQTGGRAPSSYSLSENLEYTISVLTHWFIPSRIPIGPALIVLMLVTASIAAMLLVASYKQHRGFKFEMKLPWFAGVFVLIYVIFIVATSTVIDYDRINNRLLAPIYPLVILLGFAGVESIANSLQPIARNLHWKYAVIALCSMWLIAVPFYRSFMLISRQMEQGAGYSSQAWTKSPTMEWLRAHPRDGELYSNAPDAVYILAGKSAMMSPRKPRYNSPTSTVDGQSQLIRRALESDDQIFLIWFDNVRRDYLYDVSELQAMFDLVIVAIMSDGAMYRLLPRAAPPGT